jgi:SAM-dependent methyltransferase
MKEEAYRLMADLDESYWWFRARREIICDVVARFVPPGGDVVDYGCGTGSIAARLRDLGYRAVGAEVGAGMLEACRARGISTIDLSKEWIPRSSADCVLACDVLEHAEDDLGLLRRLRGTIRAGGLLIGTVPAYEFLWSGEDYASSHFRRYTRAALVRNLVSSDYEVLWSSYFNTLLFPLALSAILAKRLFRPRDMYRSNVEPLPKWQNDFFRSVFAKERGLLRWIRLPFGLSVLFVARPREVSPGEDRFFVRSLS